MLPLRMIRYVPQVQRTGVGVKHVVEAVAGNATLVGLVELANRIQF